MTSIEVPSITPGLPVLRMKYYAVQRILSWKVVLPAGYNAEIYFL